MIGENDCYALGLSALRFFCYSGTEQVRSWKSMAHQPRPSFFKNRTEEDAGCDYFYGVAVAFQVHAECVFRKYRTVCPNEPGDGPLGAFYSFLLSVSLDARDWSESALLDEKHFHWRNIRNCARVALEKLGERLPAEPPMFDMAAETDVERFYVARESFERLHELAAVANDRYEYANGLAALQFLCYPGTDQAGAWHRAACKQIPISFPDHDDVDQGCDFFMAVARHFREYSDRLKYRRYAPKFAVSRLIGYLDEFMCNSTASDWSEVAILDEGNSTWAEIRSAASKALKELGEELPLEPPIWDFFIQEEKVGYARGLAALQFFCLPGNAQAQSRKNVDSRTVPVFFFEKSMEDAGCDYFMGVACVFKTYVFYLYARFAKIHPNMRPLEFCTLSELERQIRAMLRERNPSIWSEAAVLDAHEANWERLRNTAAKAIGEIKEQVTEEVPGFSIADIIYPDQFTGVDDMWR